MPLLFELLTPPLLLPPLLAAAEAPFAVAGRSVWGPLAVLCQADGGGVNPLVSFLPLLAMGLLAYFLFVVPQRVKDRKFQQMLDGLKENDRVVTTGGLHGVVTNVQRDAGRLTLRIDESTGAKVRVSLWAIDSVVTDDK